MNNELNPFESPQYPGRVPGRTRNDGVWRDDDVLVMRQDAAFPPDLCAKSGELASEKIEVSFSWLHPGFYLLIFAGLIFFIIAAVLCSKKALIELPLSSRQKVRRFRGIMTCDCVGLAGIVGIFVGIFQMTGPKGGNAGTGLLLAGFTAIVLTLLMGQGFSRVLRPRRIDDSYIWLKGVHPDVLASLSQFPHAGQA